MGSCKKIRICPQESQKNLTRIPQGLLEIQQNLETEYESLEQPKKSPEESIMIR